MQLKRQGPFARGESGTACVTDVADIEENIWSPLYGLKGQIDASLMVQLTDDPHGPRLLPMELKTGAGVRVTEHSAQVALYLLLMADRYGRKMEAR